MHNVCHSACPVEPTMRLSSIPALRIEWHVTSERAVCVCVCVCVANGQIPLRYPGRRQVRGWSQTCSELEFGLSSSSLAAS